MITLHITPITLPTINRHCSKCNKKMPFYCSEKFVNMVKAGIIDPTKVARSALQNATSVASTLLTTEAIVADIKEPEPPMPPGGGGMGMM